MRLLTPHQLGVPGAAPGGEADAAALDGFYLLALEKAGRAIDRRFLNLQAMK